MGGPGLSDLERELLELCAPAVGMGEPTTLLHEQELSERLDRDVVEATLRGLVARGLMTTSRGTYGGPRRQPDGSEKMDVYEDDWWVLTDGGRAAIGLPPRP